MLSQKLQRCPLFFARIVARDDVGDAKLNGGTVEASQDR